MRLLFAITNPISILLLRGQTKYNKSRGAEVFLATAYDESIEEQIIKEGFIYKRIDLKREISFIKDIMAFFRAIQILKEVKPNIVNASTPKAGLIFMLASFFVKDTYPIFTLRGIRSDSLSGFKGKIVWFMEYLTCSFAKKIIVISHSLRDHAVESSIVNKSKTIVIGKGSSNGVNISKLIKTKKTIELGLKFRKENNILEDAFVFGFIGRVVKDKGIFEMYQAFKNLKKIKNNIYLVITGEIEEDDSLPYAIINEMKENPFVIFTGFIKEISEILSVINVLILYSYREGFGNVVLEAASMEVPAIVSNIPGLSDTVEDGKTGIKVKDKDYKKLFDKMLFCVDNQSTIENYGLNARKRVVKYFSSQIIWHSIFLIYSKIYGKKK